MILYARSVWQKNSRSPDSIVTTLTTAERASAGASGGAAAERRVIAPQFVPVSQIVLLTVKVLREREARTAA